MNIFDIGLKTQIDHSSRQTSRKLHPAGSKTILTKVLLLKAENRVELNIV